MTPEQVTPELARELLAEAYPEPRFVDEWTAEEVDLRPVTVTAELVPLVEAAPALAELVANLHYEYAVQVPVATAVPGEPVWRFFVRRGTNGGAILTAVPGLAKWETSQRDAKKRAELHELTGYRIVRRLVSESEVVE